MKEGKNWITWSSMINLRIFSLRNNNDNFIWCETSFLIHRQNQLLIVIILYVMRSSLEIIVINPWFHRYCYQKEEPITPLHLEWIFLYILNEWALLNECVANKMKQNKIKIIDVLTIKYFASLHSQWSFHIFFMWEIKWINIDWIIHYSSSFWRRLNIFY